MTHTSPRNPPPTNQPQPLPDLLDASPQKDPSPADELTRVLPSMTVAEVRERLAAGQSPAFIRADATRRAAGLRPLAPPLPLDQFAAWALKSHDTTLRLLAQQEHEDVARVLAIPSPYGSADAAPINATFAPDFGDPDAIRIQRDLEPICDGDATLYEYGGPFDCPGCSACVKPAPTEGEAKP